jgi:hypothetical protein
MTMTPSHVAAAKALQTTPPESIESTTNASAPAITEARLLRRLWERMAAIFPHRWTSAMGASPQDSTGALTIAGDTWGRMLADLTPEQFARGLEACGAGSDGWPPSLPEFRGMCFGIPLLAQVRLELRPGAPDVSPFTRLVYLHLDPWALRHADARDAERMVRDAYGLAYDHVMRGGALPQAPAAVLEDKPEPPKPADPEVARAALAECRELFGKRVAEAAP